MRRFKLFPKESSPERNGEIDDDGGEGDPSESQFPVKLSRTAVPHSGVRAQLKREESKREMREMREKREKREKRERGREIVRERERESKRE